MLRRNITIIVRLADVMQVPSFIDLEYVERKRKDGRNLVKRAIGPTNQLLEKFVRMEYQFVMPVRATVSQRSEKPRLIFAMVRGVDELRDSRAADLFRKVTAGELLIEHYCDSASHSSFYLKPLLLCEPDELLSVTAASS